MVDRHVLERLAADDPPTVEFAAVEQHVDEALVIVDGTDQATAARQEDRRREVRAGVESVEGRQRILGCQLVVRREPVDLVGRDVEGRIGHAERAGDVLGEVLVEPHPRDHLDESTAHVGRHRVVPCRTGIEGERFGGKAPHALFERVVGQLEIAESVFSVHRVKVVLEEEPVGQA